MLFVNREAFNLHERSGVIEKSFVLLVYVEMLVFVDRKKRVVSDFSKICNFVLLQRICSPFCFKMVFFGNYSEKNRQALRSPDM